MRRGGASIVLGSKFLAKSPQAGGHWAWALQYPLGLRDIGHDVLWVELLRASGDIEKDNGRIAAFFDRMTAHGLRNQCVLCLADKGRLPLDAITTIGSTPAQLAEKFRSADLLWNLGVSLDAPLLSMFKKRVLIDIDPGHLQVSSLSCDLETLHHDVFLTVGRKMHDTDCEVPTLGVRWQPFSPFVYLPMWQQVADPGPQAPFTSVTQWNWDELLIGDRVVSIAKRDAYLRYIELPRACHRPFELAANIRSDDRSGDRELLTQAGWRLNDPLTVAGSPQAYQKYIQQSRAEICCPKPIFRELRTGWFSDRSVSYLASGRPVLAEDTGFSESLPVGNGLFVFRDMEQAVAGVAEIDGNYHHHSQAARALAHDLFDSRKCLASMLEACA